MASDERPVSDDPTTSDDRTAPDGSTTPVDRTESKGPGAAGRSVGRRDLLRSAGAAAVVGLAGCTTALPPLGRRVRFGRIDVPQPDDPHYRAWLPRPSALQTETDDGDPYDSFMYMEPGAWDPELPVVGLPIGRSVVVHYLDYLGVGFSNYDWVLTADEGAVLHGDVDRAVVAETLTETVYESAGSYRGFDLYRRTDEPKVVAVSGTHVVVTAGEFAAANVRAIVDTGQGRTRRYHEADDSIRRITDAAGAAPFTWVGSGLLSPTVNSDDVAFDTDPINGAIANSVRDGAIYLVHRTMFPAGRVPDEAAVRQVLESEPRALASAAVDVEIDDRLVTVEMRAIPEDLYTGTDGSYEPLRPPHVTWQTEYDAANETLVVRHLAGETFDGDRLAIGGSPTGDRNPDASGTIGPGDVLRLDVSEFADGDSLYLIYESRTGDASGTLITHEFTDDDDSTTPTASGATPTTGSNETTDGE